MSRELSGNPLHLCWQLALLGAVLASPKDVTAGGFEFPDNGTRAMGRSGAFVARADDPSAIYFNPSGLTRIKKPTLLTDLNISMVDYRFTRANLRRSGPGRALELGPFDEVKNSGSPLPAPFVAYAHPLTPNLVVGAGIYGPSAYTGRRFPPNGPQRYHLIDSTILASYSTLSAAWTTSDELFRIGVSLQAMSVFINFSSKVDGNPGALSPAYVQAEEQRWDNEVRVAFSNWLIPTGIIGATLKPTPWLEIGFSYRPPIEIEAEGHVELSYARDFLYRNADAESDDLLQSRATACANAAAADRWRCSRDPILNDDGATIRLTFPAVYRGGIRYVRRTGPEQRELFDVELDVVHETWSVLQAIEVKFAGEVQYYPVVFDFRDTPPDIERPKLPLKDRPVRLVHNWKDSTSFRLGSEISLSPTLQLRLGMSYETPTFSEEAVDLNADGFERYTASLGVSYTFAERWRVSAGYLHSFHSDFESTNSVVHAQVPLSPCVAPYTNDELCTYENEPTGNPVGDGIYKSSIDLLSLGLTSSF